MRGFKLVRFSAAAQGALRRRSQLGAVSPDKRTSSRLPQSLLMLCHMHSIPMLGAETVTITPQSVSAGS
jgi:hypothetical protein